MFSLSEPVHWIIHTKRFLLEEGQGGEGAVPHTGHSTNACAQGVGPAPGRESLEWVGYGGSKVCLRIYLHQPKAYTLPLLLTTRT